jgi:hypothetical protein
MKKWAFPKYLFAAGIAISAIHCGEDTDFPIGDDDDGFQCTICSGETICVDNARCEDAFPRFYVLEFGTVTIPQTKPDGSCWDDPNCGAPDPEIEIHLNGDQIAELDNDDDVFSASFSDMIELQLIAGTRLEIQLEDEDLIDDEEVLTCTFDPLTAEKLRSGDLSCSAGNASIEARITPRAGNAP